MVISVVVASGEVVTTVVVVSSVAVGPAVVVPAAVVVTRVVETSVLVGCPVKEFNVYRKGFLCKCLINLTHIF